MFCPVDVLNLSRASPQKLKFHSFNIDRNFGTACSRRLFLRDTTFSDDFEIARTHQFSPSNAPCLLSLHLSNDTKAIFHHHLPFSIDFSTQMIQFAIHKLIMSFFIFHSSISNFTIIDHSFTRHIITAVCPYINIIKIYIFECHQQQKNVHKRSHKQSLKTHFSVANQFVTGNSGSRKLLMTLATRN